MFFENSVIYLYINAKKTITDFYKFERFVQNLAFNLKKTYLLIQN